FRSEGFVPAKSPAGAGYEYHIPATQGEVFRLRIVDLDGSEQYSPELHISTTTVSDFRLLSLAPLPAGPQLRVTFEAEAGLPLQLRIHDMTGALRLQTAMTPTQGGSESRLLDTGTLPAGMYMLVLIADHQQLHMSLPVLQ
ncbi:MAG: T9SS type A sorting domain-containing protein, partial [Bacteroidetes bacterium]|nr:T9SS type A sorting domain-containing protein [Bacteroidota bacterium]